LRRSSAPSQPPSEASVGMTPPQQQPPSTPLLEGLGARSQSVPTALRHGQGNTQAQALNRAGGVSLASWAASPAPSTRSNRPTTHQSLGQAGPFVGQVVRSR
jgi:hypothetical protein